VKVPANEIYQNRSRGELLEVREKPTVDLKALDQGFSIINNQKYSFSGRKFTLFGLEAPDGQLKALCVDWYLLLPTDSER